MIWWLTSSNNKVMRAPFKGHFGSHRSQSLISCVSAVLVAADWEIPPGMAPTTLTNHPDNCSIQEC